MESFRAKLGNRSTRTGSARTSDADAPAQTVQSADRKVTYEIRPFLKLKGPSKSKTCLKASFNYQIWNHTAEIRVTPVHSFHGVELAVSHTHSADDQLEPSSSFSCRGDLNETIIDLCDHVPRALRRLRPSNRKLNLSRPS